MNAATICSADEDIFAQGELGQDFLCQLGVIKILRKIVGETGRSQRHVKNEGIYCQETASWSEYMDFTDYFIFVKLWHLRINQLDGGKIG